MKDVSKLAAVLAAALLLHAAAAQEIRELKNAEGKTIRAEILDLGKEAVKIRTGGRVFEVPLEKLSEEDRTWLAEWGAKRGEGRPGGSGSGYSELLFQDDFSAVDFGPRWSHYKSGSVVKDGVFEGITPVGSDHQAVDTIKFEGRRDLEVSVKFKFGAPEAQRFNLKFDDSKYKGSHAGHICRVVVSRSSVALSDDKTGTFANEIFERKSAGDGLDGATKKLLASKTVQFPVSLKDAEWHDLVIRSAADRMEVSLDGQRLGELVSEGIAHPTKTVVGMATPGKGVFYDDFVVKAVPEPGLVKPE